VPAVQSVVTPTFTRTPMPPCRAATDPKILGLSILNRGCWTTIGDQMQFLGRVPLTKKSSIHIPCGKGETGCLMSTGQED
jgi:hypothetical protein